MDFKNYFPSKELKDGKSRKKIMDTEYSRCLGILILLFTNVFLSGCSFVKVKKFNSKGVERDAASFDCEPWVHPKMIWELKPWMSDTGEQMLALNVSNSVGSNRYFEDIEMRTLEGGKELLLYKAQNGEHLQFGYVYHGMSNSGIHVLEVVESTHGSGTFISLFLCQLNWEPSFGTKNGSLQEVGERQVLKLVKEITLGDRWVGKIELEGNLLKVGKDEGRFRNPKDEGFQILLNFSR